MINKIKIGYLVYISLLFGAFCYANFTGWRIYNSDKVEHSEPGKSRGSHSSTRFYHK